MKKSLRLLVLFGALVVALAFANLAATPAQEKAFTDKYKAAMEGNDTVTLQASFTRKAQTRPPWSFTR